MGKQTVERRKSLGLCIDCKKPNDNLPELRCKSCAEKANQKNRAYYRHNRAKVLKRTRSYYFEHEKEYQKYRNEWYSKHPEFSNDNHQKAKLRALQIVAQAAHPTCAYCSCDDQRFLEINHKNGGGSKEFLSAGSNFYWAIIKGRRKTDDLEVTCGPHNKWHFYKLKYGETANRFNITWQ